MSSSFLTKDFLAGLLFASFGFLGLWLGRNLEAGTAGAMDAGYFPRLVCAVLIGLGGLAAVLALMRPGDRPERVTWRPLVMITLSAVAFALMVKPAGFVAALLTTIVLASLAGSTLRPIPLVLLAAILIAVNVGIFVLALKMPIPLWPAALS